MTDSVPTSERLAQALEAENTPPIGGDDHQGPAGLLR